MRKAKYLEILLYLLLMTAWCINIYHNDPPSSASIVLVIVVFLLIQTGFKIYSNRQCSSGEIVLIVQNESNWLKIKYVISIVALFVFTIYIFFSKEFSLGSRLNIGLPLIIVLISTFFSNNRGDFYIDKAGFIQPEFFNKNHKWSDIHNFQIIDNSINFSLNMKDFQIDISEETKLRLNKLEFLKDKSV